MHVFELRSTDLSAGTSSEGQTFCALMGSRLRYLTVYPTRSTNHTTERRYNILRLYYDILCKVHSVLKSTSSVPLYYAVLTLPMIVAPDTRVLVIIRTSIATCRITF